MKVRLRTRADLTRLTAAPTRTRMFMKGEGMPLSGRISRALYTYISNNNVICFY